MDDDAAGGPVLRGLRRVRRFGRLTWNVLGALALLAVVILAWLPVDWLLLTGRLDRLLMSWGLFDGSWLLLLGVAGAVLVLGVLAGLGRARTTGPPVVRPLRWSIVILIALAILSATGLTPGWLMELASRAQDRPKARIDAVRTAMTLGAGMVGVVVLVLTARKQWLAEHAQKHAEADATEQRVTELYSAAADQLASEQAPVRMAGLYALERLAQNNPDHRRTIVNLLCAYLRMPHEHPGAETPSAARNTRSQRLGLHRPRRGRQSPSPLADLLTLLPTLSAAGVQLDAAERQQEELQVRLTAQRLLTEHLRTDRGPRRTSDDTGFWRNIDLDLTGAVLHNWDLRSCRVRRADFTDACLYGSADFEYSSFDDRGEFSRAHFFGPCEFENTNFDGSAHFTGATFHGRADFQKGHFHWNAGFFEVGFNGHTDFSSAWFHGNAGFFGAEFHGPARFTRTDFLRQADFAESRFHSRTDFAKASFEGLAEFEGSRVRSDHDGAAAEWPYGWTMHEVGELEGRSGRWCEPRLPGPGAKAAAGAGVKELLFPIQVPESQRGPLYWEKTSRDRGRQHRPDRY